MKKGILLALTATIMATASFAQIKVGVTAGVLQNNQRVRVSNGNIYAGDNFKGYQAGVIADIPLGSNLYLQPQLQFARKGLTLLSSTGAPSANVRMSYVEMPVSLLYKFPLRFGKIYGGAGASFAYAVGGRQKQGDVKTGLYGDNGWKREDLSAHVMAGVEFNNGLFINFSTQKGLIDLHKAGNVDIKNRTMSASVGYLIDWNKFKRKA